jgi:hypothetical protein
MRPRIAFNRGATSQKRREDAHALQKSGRLPDKIIMAPSMDSTRQRLGRGMRQAATSAYPPVLDLS